MATTLSRSAFVSAAAALPLAVNASPDSDAELLRLWAEYEPLSRYINMTPGLSDDEVDELCEQANDIEFAIHETPARTNDDSPFGIDMEVLVGSGVR